MIQKIVKIIIILPNLFFRIFKRRNLVIKNIAIVQMAKLGDMVCTTPIFRAIKSSHPEWKLLVVGNETNKELTRYNKDIDEYFVWDRKSDLSLELKNRKIDAVIIPGPNDEALYASLEAGINRIIISRIEGGWSPYVTLMFRFLKFFVETRPLIRGKYVPREHLRLLEPLGIFSKDTKKYLFWSKEADFKIEEFISKINKKYSMLIGIMPAAGNKIKQWPPDRFSEVADYLVEKYGAYILVIGNKTINKDEISGMINSVKNKDWAEDCTWTSIDELKALISKLNMTVSVDTGPVFIAEANGVPTIDIAGSIDPNEMSPNDGKFHIVVRSDGKPQLWTMNARVYDYEEARRQIESVTVSMVNEKVDELLVKIRKSKN